MKVRETYHFVKENIDIRIVDIQDEQIYYVKLFDGMNYAPRTLQKDFLIKGLYSGEILKITDPYLNFEPVKLKGKRKEKYERNWEWLKELWSEYKQEILSDKTRAGVISNFAHKKNCSVETIKLLLSNFLTRGMNKEALIRKPESLDKPGKKRKITKKPGPKYRPDSPPTQKVEDIFEKSYRRYYLNKASSTIQSAYDDMLGHFFTNNGEIDHDKKPSYNQFWRWVREQEESNKISKKYSQNDYDLKHRILKSSTNAGVSGPGDIFEIDATPLDCHIVSRSNRNKVIGRPVLYVIIDRYSRLIVGMNVGLYGPSWLGAIGAFENMVEDKVEYCKKFGITITSEDWPVKNLLPYSVIGDRGEMISRSSDELSRNLKLRLENTAPYRGDMKANVERSFGVINKKIRERVDGAIIKEYRKRGDRDPRDKAKLNIEEITRVCINCVLYFNKRIIKDFPLSEDQIAFGVPAQPLGLWKYGVDHFLYSFVEIEGKDFRKSILPVVERTTSRRGIRFKNLIYTVPDPETEIWLANHLNERFPFAYDPLDVSEGYLRTEDGDIRLILSNTFSSFKGMGFEELKIYDDLRKERNKRLEDLNLTNRLELNSSLDEINNSVSGASPNISKASRKKNIKENRKNERMNKTKIVNENQGIRFTDEQEPLANNYEAIEKALKLSEKNGKS